MKFWVLIIVAMNGQTTYGYKFVKKYNCEKVGKYITKFFKKTQFKCKLKDFS
jgi:hypothetical protein